MDTILSENFKHRSRSILRAVFALVMILGLLGSRSRNVLAETHSPATKLAAPNVVPPSIFGVEMVSITPENGLDKMVQANAYWVRRNGLVWEDVEPNKGERNWSATPLDTELQTANSQGIQVVLTVRNAPEWARDIPGKACGRIKSTEFEAFGNFMQDVVSRYSVPQYSIKYYEIWNEPDIEPSDAPYDNVYGCWGDPNDNYYGGGYYAEMLKVVYPKIKAANPNAQVLLGGLLLDCDPALVNVCTNNKPPRFLEGILLAGGGNFFDGVSFHAFDYYTGTLGQYGNPNWESSWNTTGPVITAKANFIRNMLAKHGVTGKYLLNTESALLCDAGCDANFETTKAYYLAQSFAAALAANLQANIWFATHTGWRNTDLFNANLTERPAYYAFKAAQARLSNAAFVEEIKRYPGVKGYAFWSSQRRIWLLWSLDGNTHTVELPEWPLNIYDVDGDPVSVNNPVTITREPQYFEWPAARRINLPVMARGFDLFLDANFDLDVDGNRLPDGWTVASSGDGINGSLVNEHPTVPILDTAIPLGKNSFLLGSPNYLCTQVPQGFVAARQSIQVPNTPNGAALRLAFKYVIYSQDASTTETYDRFEVRINGNVIYWDGNLDNTELNLCRYRRVPASGWATGKVSLVSPVDYRGQTITVSFENWSRADNFYNTFTYLDDVRVEIGN